MKTAVGKGKDMRLVVILLFCFALVSIGSIVMADEISTGTVTGTVLVKEGVPLDSGVVYFFNQASGPPPSSDRYWRVPDEVVTTDAHGKFTAKLVEGKYYVGAIKRLKGDGQEIGPPRDGDLFLPLNNENNMPKLLSLQEGKTVNLGNITGVIRFMKKQLPEGITGIAGKITDQQGKPLDGVIVFAFTTPAMVGKPLFVSEPTGKDGKYLLTVHQGGTYYLKVRNVYGGGAMKAGDIVGSYGQDRPAAVEVKTGNIVKGIAIKGIHFPGQGPKK